MPFGVGYYGWPWHDWLMKSLLECFVYGFAFIAGLGVFYAIYPKVVFPRLVLSCFSLLFAALGVFAMLSWEKKYLFPPNM